MEIKKACKFCGQIFSYNSDIESYDYCCNDCFLKAHPEYGDD